MSKKVEVESSIFEKIAQGAASSPYGGFSIGRDESEIPGLEIWWEVQPKEPALKNELRKSALPRKIPEGVSFPSSIPTTVESRMRQRRPGQFVEPTMQRVRDRDEMGIGEWLVGLFRKKHFNEQEIEMAKEMIHCRAAKPWNLTAKQARELQSAIEYKFPVWEEMMERMRREVKGKYGINYRASKADMDFDIRAAKDKTRKQFILGKISLFPGEILEALGIKDQRELREKWLSHCAEFTAIGLLLPSEPGSGSLGGGSSPCE